MIGVVHSFTPRHASIRIPGYDQALRVYHFSDTHLDLWDERDEEAMAQRGEDEPRTPPRGAALLYEHLERAREGGAHLMVMAGDLFHFPSLANVEAAQALVAQSPLPMLFTPGNHDWFFPGMDGWEELRAQYIHRLDAFTAKTPGFQSVDFHGLRFLLVDNSTYFITRDQLDQTRAALDAGRPSILVQHIPLSLPTLRDAVIAQHGSPILMGDPAARPPRPGVDVDATEAYLELISTHPGIVAMLSAHVHLEHVDSIHRHSAQYICDAGYREGFRFVDFSPG